MKIKTLFKLILVVVLLTGLVGAGSFLLSSQKTNLSKVAISLPDNTLGWKFPITRFPSTGTTNGKLLAYSSIRDPGGIPQGLPVRLKIPVIGVDSAIEDALITPDGRMDVPIGSVNVAWFALGPHPGQIGSAVIGGHFGISNGVPFVFYNLNKMKTGDKIYIVNDKGDTLAFVVRSISSFDRNADASTVFTSQDGIAHLNLITCEGIWNQVNGNYPLRLVIFADAIPGEGSVALNPLPVVAAKPIVPQSIIITPNPTSISTPIPTVLPTLALNKKITSPSRILNYNNSSQILVASAKSLYATPIDGLITAFLILSIIFTTFKIIRR
jgi:LPXTG-site transpeptidase (sortase) family protein